MVDRKKNIVSVHLRTGRIDNAYAAGIDSNSTRMVEMMLHSSELISAGRMLLEALNRFE